MNFELNDDQRLLADSVGRLLADRGGFDARAAILRDGAGWNRALWRNMAELGLLGLGFAENDGGLGGGGVETMIVAEALGRGLSLEPWLATTVLAGGALRRGASAAQRAARVPDIIAGKHIMAFAHAEPDALRHTFDAKGTAARREGDRWTLTGTKIAVLHGADADELVVSAATDAGTSLFLVDATTAGVRCQGVIGYDGIPVATIRFDAAPAEPLGGGKSGRDVLVAVIDDAIAALCAEAVGAMAETIDLTSEYLKTRQQFGTSLGAFQALQHRLVDMLIQVELSRSIATHAALSIDGPSAANRTLNVSAAKVQIGRAGRMVGQNAVQLHGAIGFTSEYKVGHLFKRLTAIDALFGDADHHLARIAAAPGLPELA